MGTCKYIRMDSLRSSVTVYSYIIVCLWHHCPIMAIVHAMPGIIKWGCLYSNQHSVKVYVQMKQMNMCAVGHASQYGQKKKKNLFFYRTIKVSGIFIIQTFILFKLHINGFLLLENTSTSSGMAFLETGNGSVPSVSYPKRYGRRASTAPARARAGWRKRKTMYIMYI